MDPTRPEVELIPPPPDPIPEPGATYWSNAYRDRPRLRPRDSITALGILAHPDRPQSLIGIGYPYGYVGGMTAATGPLDDYPPPEVVFRLVLDRAWIDGRAVARAEKLTLDGRFVLRSGRFVELSEDAD